MLKHTRSTINDIVIDLKRFAFSCGIVTNSLPIIYLIYALFAPAGIFWINIALLIPSVFYLAFYIMTHESKDRAAKRTKRITKHAFKGYKLLIKLLSAVVAVYTIYATSGHVTVWSVVLAGFTVITMLFQMILELLVIYAEIQRDKIIQSLSDDFDFVMKPINQIKGWSEKRKHDDEVQISLLDEPREKKRFFDRFARR